MDRNYQSFFDTNTNREEWEFSYSATDVLAGAREQLEYRKGRVKVWEAEKAKVMSEIKAQGLTIQEPLAEKMSNYTVSHQSAHVTVDPQMQRNLNECVEKIRTHRDLVTKYDAWVQLLEKAPSSHLLLKHGDWMFFFGR